ncbi:hypothetical protein BJF78_34360 [Pseudonocardia sp. CNS-139]|nr:hypothetical protein BJF78_34360 [Pseudonocardia sp. CNS-139]
MDENLRDRFLSRPRAAELAELDRRPSEDVTVADVRQSIGAPGISDEELVLRAIMQGTGEIDAMRAAGPPKRYTSAGTPLVALMDRLASTNVRYVRVQHARTTISLSTRS